MQAIDALALGASDGHAKTGAEWKSLLGVPQFESAIRNDWLVGPIGASIANCYRCQRPGHSAPIYPNDIGGYDMFCLDAGAFQVPADRVEGWQVSRRTFLTQFARALRVEEPDAEPWRIDDELFRLGSAHFGDHPFSLIAALDLRTVDQVRSLERRNREGFGGQPGLIVCCLHRDVAEDMTGFHAVRQFSAVSELVPEGVKPRWDEIRRALRLPGRMKDGESKLVQAQRAFETLLIEFGTLPRGQEAIDLLKGRHPNLRGVSRATLYQAKNQALKAINRRSAV